jgi:predicted nuclease of restriction endonuclease-like (RecB) superfamily
MNEIEKHSLLSSVSEIILKARQTAYRSNNAILLNMYWEIGRLIVEDEQQGKAKATYGKATLKVLSRQLTLEFGQGFDESNLRNIRQFYLAFQKRDAVRHELSWTHYRLLSRIENEKLRLQYLQYSIEGNWNTRTLERNIKTQYIGRIIEPETTKNQVPENIVKDPYIFEFLGMGNNKGLTENKIETALINHLQQFLMELGKGFAFVARQQHIVTDTSDFYIDLVFYNYYLKCFVLIELLCCVQHNRSYVV